MSGTKKFNSISEATDWTLSQLGNSIVMATPLGLGKPNLLINAIYERVKATPNRELRIFTALSLAIPENTNELQRRLIEPFKTRQWGSDYPELQYLKDLEKGGLPPNIHLHEFYLQAGKALNSKSVQRNYISLNYTHVVYAFADRGTNLLVQMVAKNSRKPGFYSLSSNPDLTLDLVDDFKRRGKKLIVVGMVHPDMPYCGADAEVPESFFDAIIESPEIRHKIFALPRQPISAGDYMVGLHASMLIEDGGTLQIGIGSLSDAIVYCMLLRHQNNSAYQQLVSQLVQQRPYARMNEKFHTDTFQEGLYGTSEMIMDGFMHLRRGGILKREIFDLDHSIKRYLHGAFFLGSNEFYSWLREVDQRGDQGLCMTRVSKVNDLYDKNELALRRQRVKARFFNTCMGVTLLGGAASETLPNGQVVSGVGGQFNFVAMSHELPDSFSVLMLRSLRHSKNHVRSTFMWNQEQLTVPRHLRDVVISEYGIAFLKNRTDEEVIQAQLAIADSQFQNDLRATAIQNAKLQSTWQIPEWARANTPEWPEEFLKEVKSKGLFPDFPFGSDFTPVEEQLVLALTKLKKATGNKRQLAKVFWRGLTRSAEPFRDTLERMQLLEPKSPSDRMYKILLLGVL